MSQEKVDYNKEQKKNRKKIMKKHKIERVLSIVAGVAIAVVLIGWVSFSAYKNHKSTETATVTYNNIDTSALTDYISTINN